MDYKSGSSEVRVGDLVLVTYGGFPAPRRFLGIAAGVVEGEGWVDVRFWENTGNRNFHTVAEDGFTQNSFRTTEGMVYVIASVGWEEECFKRAI